MSILIGILEEGLIYAILALGVYITYKILDFPDLSVDGTFPLGAAVTAMLILKDIPPALTLPLASIRDYRDDCLIFGEFADRREGKPAHIQQGYDF